MADPTAFAPSFSTISATCSSPPVWQLVAQMPQPTTNIFPKGSAISSISSSVF